MLQLFPSISHDHNQHIGGNVIKQPLWQQRLEEAQKMQEQMQREQAKKRK